MEDPCPSEPAACTRRSSSCTSSSRGRGGSTPRCATSCARRWRRSAARVDAGSEADRPLADRVSDLMLRFEAAHPALADAVGAVARALARLGI